MGKTQLEYDVLIVLVAKKVFGLALLTKLLRIALVGRLFSLEFCCCCITLLLSRYLLESVELFSIELIKLRIDILYGVFGSRDDDVFTAAVSVNAS